MIRISGNVFEEVEISLYCQFKNIWIEAEVPGFLVFVFAVLVAITQLCVPAGNPHTDVVAELFTEEQTHSWFRPVETGSCVEVAEIMSGTERKAELALLNISILCESGITKDYGNKKRKNDAIHFQKF